MASPGVLRGEGCPEPPCVTCTQPAGRVLSVGTSGTVKVLFAKHFLPLELSRPWLTWPHETRGLGRTRAVRTCRAHTSQGSHTGVEALWPRQLADKAWVELRILL